MSNKKICPMMSKVVQEEIYRGSDLPEKAIYLHEVECKREECALWQNEKKQRVTGFDTLKIVQHEGCKLGRINNVRIH